MQSRINRYIMECKFGSNESLFYRTVELIDTLWNVNMVFITADEIDRLN